MKQVAVIVASFILLLAAAVIGFYWWIFHPRVEKTSGPVTREVALRYLSPDWLPASAYDIQYYSWFLEVSPGFEEWIRFEASLRDSHALAHRLLGKTWLEPVSHPPLPDDTDRPAWFDPNHISEGIAGGKGYDGEPQVWIDEKRGIFYYHLSD